MESSILSKKFLVIDFLITIIIVGAVYYFWDQKEEKNDDNIDMKTTKKLTLSQIENANYCSLNYDGEVKLTNGEYEGSIENPPAFAGISSDSYAVSNLNNDNIKEAAVVFYTSGGGSGTFYELVVFKNQNGNPVCLDSISLGDRVEIKSLKIEKREIIVEMISHGSDDPLCCPTEETKTRYKLENNKLKKVKKIEDRSENKTQEGSGACDFNGAEDVGLRQTETYGIFGDDTFDTIVCGYLITRTEEVWEEKQANAYFRIIKYYDDEFRKTIKKGIDSGNTINSKTDDSFYDFGLGCYVDEGIEGTEHEEGENYLNAETEYKILESSKNDPVSIVLSFGEHSGSGCACCNLAHKIRIFE